MLTHERIEKALREQEAHDELLREQWLKTQHLAASANVNSTNNHSV